MVVVVKGGFSDSSSKAEHQKFFQDFSETLRGFGLPVSAISSEKETGGSISLDVPDDLELNEVTRSLASFAEVLARQVGRDIYFDIEVLPYQFRVAIAGAA